LFQRKYSEPPLFDTLISAFSQRAKEILRGVSEYLRFRNAAIGQKQTIENRNRGRAKYNPSSCQFGSHIPLPVGMLFYCTWPNTVAEKPFAYPTPAQALQGTFIQTG